MAAPPPQLVGDKMAAMQHGHHGNDVWFVFANVTSPGWVCARFQARSAYVTSGLRPAYARAYPVGRPDLTVDTFYHVTDRSSAMLKLVTHADVVTWFGATRGGETNASCAVNKPTGQNKKASLWDLIKEAVTDDDVRPNELSNVLRETDDDDV